MGDADEVVKVGQYWAHPFVQMGKPLRVSTILSGYVWVEDPPGHSVIGFVGADGCPAWTCDSAYWHRVREAEAEAAAGLVGLSIMDLVADSVETPVDRDREKLVAFFRATPPGYCPCNIRREVCKYHG